TRLAVETPGGVVIVPALGGRSTVVAGSDTLAPRFGHDWAPDGRRLALAAAGSLYLVDPERGPERLLYRGFWGAYGASVPAFAPDGERVAFVIDNPDFVFGSVANFANIAPSRLAIVRIDGSGPRTILDDGALSTSPAWLPDGRALLYVSSRAGGRDVHRLALDEAGRAAGEPERLTTGASAQTLTLARDGATLAYSRFLSRANVWSLAIPARGVATLDSAVEVTSGSQTVEGFDLSPDGRTLAFDSDREGNQDIYVMSLPDGRVTRLTSDARDDFMPRWSHDGRWLAFHSIRQGARDAFVLRVDGGAPEQVTADPAQDRYPSFAPGDSMLVLESDRRDSTRAAYVVRGRPGLGWGTPERVSPGGGRWPKFSPATGELLYWSDDGIYVRPAGGEAARRIVTGRPYATFWSDDGRTVYYIPIAEDSTSGVWAVPVEGGTPRQLVRFAPDGPQVRRVFFTARNGRFYFSMMQHESDLWSLDLVQR
ncbi:MAG TPA: hypothetical protein VFX50_07820, partial [Gemmatimonadales bacterium]|nr:hypothetical protein [Gemmatimonadales bacterium]